MKIGSPSDFVQDDAAEDYWLAALRPRLAEVDKFKGHFRRRKAFERESEAIRKALLALYVHYNRLAPIHRFPPEILCRIFSFNAIDELADSEMKRSVSPSALGWIKVTHVCNYWREAALQEPNLWTNVTYSLGRRWGEWMLARSKTVPISVSSNYRGRFDETLSGHISRITGLDIDDRNEILRRVAPSWNAPATLLESLVLSSPFCLVSLPADAFGGYAPLLRQVILRDVYLSYDSAVLANLTYLDFTWSRQHPGDPKPTGLRCHRIDHLLSSLARMPALRALMLHNCLPPPAPDISPICVRLSDLGTLRLVGTTAQCGEVMDHLEFPLVCKIYINLLGYDESEHVPQGNVLHGLRAHFFGKTTTPSRMPASIYFLSSADDRYVEAWIHDDDDQTHDETQYPGHKAVISLQQEVKAHSLEEICDALPLEELRVLRKENRHHSSWTPQQWLATFGRCRAMEHVLVDEINVIRFSEAFFNLPHEPESDAASSLGDLQGNEALFPDLQSLSLRAIDFCTRYEGKHRLHYFFAKWLRIRQDIAPLPRLRILESAINPDQIEIFKKVVEVDLVDSPRQWADSSGGEEISDDEGIETDGEDNGREDTSEGGRGTQ